MNAQDSFWFKTTVDAFATATTERVPEPVLLTTTMSFSLYLEL